MAIPPGPAPMTPTRGLRFDITGLVGEITLGECDGGHTWQCYISSLICKTAKRRRCSCRVAAKIDQNRRATLTRRRRVTEACESRLHGPVVSNGAGLGTPTQ